MRSLFFASFILVLALILSACSSHSNDLTTDSGALAEGGQLLERGFYEESRKQFMRIKTEFPQSPLQVQASLKLAESYFKEESYGAAATSYQEFIKTYPGRPEIPDALFQLGLCYAQQMPSTAQRDTRATGQALDTFTRLLADYPDFSKREEAQRWIEKSQNQLADKIFEIARYYEKRGLYDSAARRYAEVVRHYGFLPQAKEAMTAQIRCLRKAGQNDAAENLVRDFNQRFPSPQ